MGGRRWYQSRFLIVGVMLLALGAGNTVIGSRKLAQYEDIVAEGRARGHFPDGGAGGGVLRPLDDEGERYNIAGEKVDLYHVVLSGGLLMMVLGTVLSLIAWLRLRLGNESAARLHAAR